MFRLASKQVWAFDAEWVPDPSAGRRLYKLDASVSDREVVERMWLEAGASEEEPHPYLKSIQCRVVSISAVTRIEREGSVTLSLRSLPQEAQDPTKSAESAILSSFLGAIGKHQPQLVGFHSAEADMKILIQRSIVNGVSVPEFCKRPNKPWEGNDYFARSQDIHLDLKALLSGFGKNTMTLNELAVLSGIPGKMDVSGSAVAELWLEGKYQQIINYNEFDALTTYLVWLRAAHFVGIFDADSYAREQNLVREMINALVLDERYAHLNKYLAEWDRLSLERSQDACSSGG